MKAITTMMTIIKPKWKEKLEEKCCDRKGKLSSEENVLILKKKRKKKAAKEEEEERKAAEKPTVLYLEKAVENWRR